MKKQKIVRLDLSTGDRIRARGDTQGLLKKQSDLSLKNTVSMQALLLTRQGETMRAPYSAPRISQTGVW